MAWPEGTTEAQVVAGRYQLGPVIGTGGMAEVRAGTDRRLERPVAVKLMRGEMSAVPAVRMRFEDEARLAARLSHPHVVGVYDCGEDRGVPFIVMERLPGDTLADRLAAGPMPAAEVRDLALVVLAALECAHRGGVVHRDIKPGNILASPSGWKVADFGIAKAVEAGAIHPADGTVGGDHTATGLLLGTPAYLAPERLVGHPATVASDLYSLGVVLYEALTGAKPFGADDGWSSLAARAAAPEPPPLPGATDPTLAAVIRRAMESDPGRRFASAADMAHALDTAATAPTSAGPATAAPPTVPLTGDRFGWGPAATEVLPLSARPVPRPAAHLARRLPTRALVPGALAVLILIAVIATLVKGSSHRAPTTPSTAPPPAAASAASPSTIPPGLQRALGDLQKQVRR